MFLERYFSNEIPCNSQLRFVNGNENGLGLGKASAQRNKINVRRVRQKTEQTG